MSAKRAKNVSKEQKALSVEDHISKIIKNAFESRASDIHFDIYQDGGCLRLRIDGTLQKIETIESDTYIKLIAHLKDLSKMDSKTTRQPQDGRMQVKLKESELDLRVSTVPTCFGESAVIRILSRDSIALTIDNLGFFDDHRQMLERWSTSPCGTILVTGPTGSGKTTVLYSILQEINKESVKIYSIEDPVEYTIKGVSQIQVDPTKGVTFGRACRAILRQDPDVIMVGELRDMETANIIIQASLTGHLVLSALHTNNATSGVVRLMDIGVQPFLIRDTLNGIMCQRLVRRLCKHCKEEYEPDQIANRLLRLPHDKYYRSRGCKECSNTGYRGRIAIFELFELSSSTFALLAEKAPHDEVRKQALREGLVTLWHDGVRKAADGQTSIEEVLRVTGGPDDLL